MAPHKIGASRNEDVHGAASMSAEFADQLWPSPTRQKSVWLETTSVEDIAH
jgi:hypothetical protein